MSGASLIGQPDPSRPYVRIRVADTGSGIPAETLNRIFDPFFTTKSKGSGLGLYNAGIAVEKHQGAISVESQEGVGTTFHIWLPQTDFSEPDSMAASPQLNRTARPGPSNVARIPSPVDLIRVPRCLSIICLASWS